MPKRTVHDMRAALKVQEEAQNYTFDLASMKSLFLFRFTEAHNTKSVASQVCERALCFAARHCIRFAWLLRFLGVIVCMVCVRRSQEMLFVGRELRFGCTNGDSCSGRAMAKAEIRQATTSA